MFNTFSKIQINNVRRTNWQPRGLFKPDVFAHQLHSIYNLYYNILYNFHNFHGRSAPLDARVGFLIKSFFFNTFNCVPKPEWHLDHVLYPRTSNVYQRMTIPRKSCKAGAHILTLLYTITKVVKYK